MLFIYLHVITLLSLYVRCISGSRSQVHRSPAFLWPPLRLCLPWGLLCIGVFYKLVYKHSEKCSNAWAFFLPLACIYLFYKYLHSPLCAYLQNRNLLRNSLKLASSLFIEHSNKKSERFRSARAEDKLAWTMPSVENEG